MDYTVIINVRQHFGDNKKIIRGLETQAPFVGISKDYQFVCPNVDQSQPGVLLFQTMGVTHRDNVLEINGQRVFGGIPTSYDAVEVVSSGTTFDLTHAKWNANVMLVGQRVLVENNVLHIESVNKADFIIDNVVILFKTRFTPIVDGGTVGPAHGG